MPTRTEHDLLGEVQVPADALHGAHTQRAIANFAISHRPPHSSLIHAYGLVKLACGRVNHRLGHLEDDVFQALEQACTEMTEGALDAHVVVDALQGGAGTSTKCWRTGRCRFWAVTWATTTPCTRSNT
jgi:aspartate ammonia-lyase